jgi:hypothetical protein
MPDQRSRVALIFSRQMKNIIVLLLLMPLAADAQVDIVKDRRLDLLMQKQEELNRKAYLDNNRTGAGFRILVVSTNDRNQAFSVKTTLMREFPDQKTYLMYQSPYFKIHIGNFRTRKDADALRRQIMEIYPTGVIVIPSTVELKPEEDLQVN